MISTVSHLELSAASTDLDTTPLLLFSVVAALLVDIEGLPRSIIFAMSSLSSFVGLVGFLCLLWACCFLSVSNVIQGAGLTT